MERTRRQIWSLGVLVLALAGACSDAPRPGVPTAGEPAPAFAAPLLGGDTLSLADLRGQTVVLNIWATWCPPCREEMPALEQLHQQYAADGLQVVGVSIDSRAAATEVRRFLDDNAISFTILHDADERVTRAFRTAGVPETFLIDREGRVVKRWIGKIDPQSEEIQRLVRETLGLPLERTT
jgi:cytochrome c biogenesis protein CcmG, thiol:disulfide interchange protein DsbE